MSPIERLSREEVRSVDQRTIEEFGLPGIALMENAGRGVFELLVSLKAQGPIKICAGKGNNGGDGFVIARHLTTPASPSNSICSPIPNSSLVMPPRITGSLRGWGSRFMPTPSCRIRNDFVRSSIQPSGSSTPYWDRRAGRGARTLRQRHPDDECSTRQHPGHRSSIRPRL